MTPSTAPTGTAWQIDASHSTVEFAVKHMMFTTVKGHFTGVSGTIRFDPGDPSASAVEATVDATTIDTREANRDTHLRSPDFFNVERYPTLTFRSTHVESKGKNRFLVTGDLTIAGNTRPVALETTFEGQGTNPWGKTVAGFTAETTISRQEFGLTWNVALEAGGVLVGDAIKISLDIQAVRQD